MKAKVRLYVDHLLRAGQSVDLSREQAHYLFGVMRLAVGAKVALFNGKDGEYLAQVSEAGKRSGVLTCVEQTKPLILPPDLWLFFAPIKKMRTDFIVEKAAELGVARICPVQTEFTNSERIRRDRLQAHAIEAAEQCGGTFVPEVTDMLRLDRVLEEWPEERKILFCDEGSAGRSSILTDFFATCSDTAHMGQRAPWAIFIGPEGGFSDRERNRLVTMPQSHTISLGPRILRADTAAVSAITLWQSHLGDWQ